MKKLTSYHNTNTVTFDTEIIQISNILLPAMSSSACEVTGASAELANVESSLSLELDLLRIFTLGADRTVAGDRRICKEVCADCIEAVEILVPISQRSLEPEELFRDLVFCFLSVVDAGSPNQ